MGITATDRDEVRAMRDRLARRAEQLDDECAYGRISDRERYEKLESEFGHDWPLMLQELNQILHTTDRPRTPHAGLAVMVTVGVGVLLMIAMMTPMMTGATVVERESIRSGAVLFDADAVRIQTDHPITDIALEAEYQGPGNFEILIEDVKERRSLAAGDSQGFTCEGCQGTYEPPIMISAATGGGSVTIDGFSYAVIR